MTHNSWGARLVIGLAILISAPVHAELTAALGNTPWDMFLYHGSAAAVDYLLLILVPFYLTGQLADDMQVLCLVSMVVNFLGWLAYLAYAPPTSYNVVIIGVGYVQIARLFMADHYGSDRMGMRFFRGHDPRGTGQNYEKAK